MIVYDGSLVVHQNKYDLCNKKKKPDLIRINMANFAVPSYCPVAERLLFCQTGTKLFALSSITQKMFSLFAITSNARLRINIAHDSGVSCFEADTKISKLK